jgi:hypothetical protein
MDDHAQGKPRAPRGEVRELAEDAPVVGRERIRLDHMPKP